MIQIRPHEPRYDDRHYLRLSGVSGLMEGETLKICLGESVVVGRSRTCQLSLKKTPRFLTADGERTQIESSLAYRAVSRRHVRLSYLAPDVVEIENLSQNGTLVDGHLVDRVSLDDVRRRSHDLRLGPHGDALTLSCGSVEVDIAVSA